MQVNNIWVLCAIVDLVKLLLHVGFLRSITMEQRFKFFVVFIFFLLGEMCLLILIFNW